MEVSIDRKPRLEDASKDDLLQMVLQLEVQKAAAQETIELSNVEKDKIKEKALALLKRCRELESKQGEIDDLKNKLQKLEASPTSTTDASHGDTAVTDEKYNRIVSELQERCRTLQSENDHKVAEMKAINENCEGYKNQGITTTIKVCIETRHAWGEFNSSLFLRH